MERTTITNLFRMQITAIRKNAPTTEPFVTEDRADRELIAFTQKQMREAMAKARLRGRKGWWNENDCHIQHLEELLIEAVQERNWINIINYAAMINARLIADE